MNITVGKEWFEYAISRISDYRGRAGRTEYAWFMLGQVVMFGLCYELDRIFHSFPAFVGVYAAFTIVPTFLLVIRRLHDCGYEGKWAFLCVILFPALLILLFLPSDKAEPNAYGYTERLIYLEKKPHKYVPTGSDDDAMIDFVPVEQAIEKRDEEDKKVQKEVDEMIKEEASPKPKDPDS